MKKYKSLFKEIKNKYIIVLDSGEYVSSPTNKKTKNVNFSAVFDDETEALSVLSNLYKGQGKVVDYK